MDEATELRLEACRLRAEKLMLRRDGQLHARALDKEVRYKWLLSIRAGGTWEQIQDDCGVAKFTLAKQLAKARQEHPDLAASIPRNRPRPGVSYPCGVGDCPAIFESAQALGGHRNVHRKAS